jgi:hypothetical protein
MELEHRHIETNEIRLHLVEAGPKSGIQVLIPARVSGISVWIGTIHQAICHLAAEITHTG